jgi:hypothetical protein
MTANQYLDKIINVISRSGDPDREFYYLGGPMTGIPQFNFPEFKRVADRLRDNGYNIISPAELDDPETEAAALASLDGAPGSGAANDEPYEWFLSRDIVVVSLPTCIGGIFLENWHHSRGARGESWVLQFLGKELFEYDETGGPLGSPRLTAIDRDVRLAQLDALEAGVPLDAPGERTAAALAPQSNAGAVICQPVSPQFQEV